mgnify:CR=1 FL=1
MKLYYKLLSSINNIKLREFESWCTQAHWFLTITLKKKNQKKKSKKFLKKKSKKKNPIINPIENADTFRLLINI